MKRIFKYYSIVFTTLLLMFVCNSACYAWTLEFAQLSDVHLCTTRKDTSHKKLFKSKNIFEQVANQLKNTKHLKFIMLTGDATDLPQEKEIKMFFDIINSTKHSWYMAFGNHDISISGDITKKKYLQLLSENNKNFDFDKSYYAFSPKIGYRVIVLDAVNDKKITSNGFFPEEELKWLDNELYKSRKKVVLIFLHHPIVQPFSSPSHSITNAMEADKIIHKYSNPIAVFSGHYHVTRIKQKNNVIYVSTPSLVTYPYAYRLVKIKDKRKKTTFEFVLKTVDIKALGVKPRYNALISSTYSGQEKDRNAIITIDKNRK